MFANLLYLVILHNHIWMTLMATMNISLPDSLKHYVKERVTSSDYSNPSDYVRSLIRLDQAQERLENLLLEGLNSGTPTPLEKSDWENFRNIVDQHR